MTGLPYDETAGQHARWWQVILRVRLWRYRRRAWREWNALPPDIRATVEVMRRRVDAWMFFGNDGRL